MSNPVKRGAVEKVFVPVNVWEPVETTHRAVPDASGRLKVCTFPDEVIEKSIPVVPIAKV